VRLESNVAPTALRRVFLYLEIFVGKLNFLLLSDFE